MADAPLTLEEYRRDLERALALMDKKSTDYTLARDYYDGTRAEISATAAVAKIIEKSAEAAPLSFAHIPVDVIADKVELASLTAQEAPAAAALETIFDANDLDDEADDWVRKACFFGDYYVVVNPDAEDQAGNVAAEDLQLIPASPLTTIAMYDPKDGRTKLYGLRRWEGRKGVWHALLYYDDTTIRLVTGGDVKYPKATDFDLDLGDSDEGSERIDHLGGRMLLEHLAIDSKPYGTPVHRKAWGPQDAITKISATNLVNVDGQGFAARWALADPTADIDDDIDADFGTDGPTTTPSTADGMTKATRDTSRVRSMPGAIALLTGIKQVGQFDAHTSEDFLKNLDWYVRAMAVACGIALFEFDMSGTQPSGESRRRAEGRANKHARKVQRRAGAFFRAIADTALAVMGITATVSATFNPLETSTDKEGIELVAAKIMTGVPISQALLEAGYTDEQVAAWFPEGEQRLTPALLAVIGTALKELATAATLGVITQAQIVAALPWLFSEGAVEPVVELPEVDEQIVDDGPIADAQAIKAKADAHGALVRSGADPAEAAAYLGIVGVTFPNVPVTVRIPEEDATQLEQA